MVETAFEYPAVTVLLPRVDWAEVLFEKLGHQLTLGDHLSNEVLFNSRMELGQILKSDRQCEDPGCSLPALPQRIRRVWPQMLSIRSTISNSSNLEADRTSFDAEFSIPSGSKDSPPTVYTCVGRILHSDNHYTSQFFLNGEYYNYDDQKGKLTRARKSKSGPIVKRTKEEVYYVYNLSSGSRTVRFALSAP